MSHLNVPRFADFLHDMGKDKFQAWQDDALRTAQNIGIAFDLTSQEDWQRFILAMFTMNQRATVLMLQDYHDWLIDKLDASSLHLI